MNSHYLDREAKQPEALHQDRTDEIENEQTPFLFKHAQTEGKTPTRLPHRNLQIACRAAQKIV